MKLSDPIALVSIVLLLFDGTLTLSTAEHSEVTQTSNDVVELATTNASNLSYNSSKTAIITSPENSPAPKTNNTALTDQNWTNFDYTHNKFCGPKIVGGYAIATSQCSPATRCGFSSKQATYGSSGNDCPKDLMCYNDIVCVNGPGPDVDNVANAASSGGSAINDESTNSTGNDGKLIISHKNNIMTITSRGSYCGISHSDALSTCSQESHCSSDNDCISGTCHADISCTYSVEDLAALKDNRLDFDGVIVSSLLEDISSSTRSSNVQGYLIGFGLCGVVGWLLF